MSSHVNLPLWLFVVMAILAALAVLDRIVFASLRWALRRRANKAIGELNARLRLRIQPFKLTKRQVLIDRLVFDPEVLQAIEAHSTETGEPHEVVMEKVKVYASEIVPSFSAYTYFRVGTRIAKRVSELLYRVRIGVRNEEALAAVDPKSSVVFVINHRSNMDYVLVTYAAATSSALSYAVGEWAQVWGLRALIRSMGAYFISRESRGPLYRKVLARYVHMATAAGVTQAIFPEGGLTRDGRLRPPRFGLLGYMVAGFDPTSARDVVFIPVAVNYDRVLEDRMLTSVAATPAGAKPVYGFNAPMLARHVLHHLWLALRGEWFRFGYACVSFGEPVSLRKYTGAHGLDFRALTPERRLGEIEKFGNDLMEAVGRIVPALPVPLVATALLEAHDRPPTLLDIKSRVSGLIDEMESSGGYVHIPRADRDYAISFGLRALVLRNLVTEADGGYRVNPDDRVLLQYYANSIAHLLDKVDQSAAPQIAPSQTLE